MSHINQTKLNHLFGRSTVFVKNGRLLQIVALSFVLAACNADGSRLVDPSSAIASILPASSDTAGNPNSPATSQPPKAQPNQPPEPLVRPTPSDPNSTPPQNPAPITPTSNSGLSPELALLTRGLVTFVSTYIETDATLTNTISFTEQDYLVNDGTEFLAVRSGNIVSACAYEALLGAYLCIFTDDIDEGLLMHLFQLSTPSSGFGVFEFCNIQLGGRVCANRLTTSPDGTSTVTIGGNASTSYSDALAYFSYAEQGVTNRSYNNTSNNANESAISAHIIHTLVSTLNKL